MIAIILAATLWQPCPTTCAPPATTTIVTGGLSSLPLYQQPVRWHAEVKSGNGPMWQWAKVGPGPACTPAQLANVSDKVACAVKVGEVLMTTTRVRQVQ